MADWPSNIYIWGVTVVRLAYCSFSESYLLKRQILVTLISVSVSPPTFQQHEHSHGKLRSSYIVDSNTLGTTEAVEIARARGGEEKRGGPIGSLFLWFSHIPMDSPLVR